VFGGGTPTGTFDGATVQTASTGALGLNNGGDTVTLADPLGATVVEEVYSSASNNQSITRDPNFTGPFVDHTVANGAQGTLYSPGELLDDTPPVPTAVKIHEIQGDQSAATKVSTDDLSPLVGQTVTVEAIVTADFQEGLAGAAGDLDGFYIQEEAIDYDMSDLTSEGIFIFEGQDNLVLDVNVGDLVEVTGVVGENFGQTQITATEITFKSAGNMLPAATTVTFPVATAYLTDDSTPEYVANLEAYEGMLVNVPQDMIVTELFNLDRFGEYRISNERDVQFTQDNDPDVAGYTQHLQDLARNGVFIDDGSGEQNPSAIEIIDGANNVLDAADTFGMGDTIGNITGVVGYGFDQFRIQNPTGTYADANPRETGRD